LITAKLLQTTVNDAKTTQDELTKSYREAIDVNQQLKVAIQTELTGAITQFAALTKNVITELRDTLKFFTKDRSAGANDVDLGNAAVNMEGVPLITPEAPVAALHLLNLRHPVLLRLLGALSVPLVLKLNLVPRSWVLQLSRCIKWRNRYTNCWAVITGISAD
jgi:hypothetical protein